MYKRELEVAVNAAIEAGKLLRAEVADGKKPRASAHDKADVDEDMGYIIGSILSSHFPDDIVLIEEGWPIKEPTLADVARGRAWHIDPHDGTSKFLVGHRETSVSIGLVEHGEVVVGVVFAPFDACFHLCGSRITRVFPDLNPDDGLLLAYAKGEEFTLNQRPASAIRAVIPDSDPRILLHAPTRSVHRLKALKAAQTLIPGLQLVQCASIATRMALTAAGIADFSVSLHPLNEYDFLGSQALLQAVGSDLFSVRVVSDVEMIVSPVQFDRVYQVEKLNTISYAAGPTKEQGQWLAELLLQHTEPHKYIIPSA